MSHKSVSYKGVTNCLSVLLSSMSTCLRSGLWVPSCSSFVIFENINI